MKQINYLFILTFCVFMSFNECHSQDKFISLTLSNNTTGLPVLAYPDLFYSQFHPGIDITYSHQLKKSLKNKLYVAGNLGFYHHQFVQDLVRIFPTFTYERAFSEQFQVQAGLGAGYGLSFEGKNAFKLQDDGSYVNKGFNGARSQYLIALEFGVTYTILQKSILQPQLLVQFKSFMQGTYVKSYVPLLPLNSFNLGIRIPLKTQKT